MSRTKVGVVYFADEAKEYLASATELVEKMEHNTYSSAQMGKTMVLPASVSRLTSRSTP